VLSQHPKVNFMAHKPVYPDTYHDEYNRAFESMTNTVKQFITQHELNTITGIPTGTAVKHDQDKLPMHLLSTEALEQIAAVLQFGAQKYESHNWRKGFVWSRPLSAALRHILAFNNGEDRDPESNLSHLAHAACCIMFLLEFEKTRPELDDRYKDV
jgi:hypothetical protein